ncbi:MAG: hypothetical protein J3R72DRAFT_16403 [Linnemannia gamsii]|nr:MAG: hypothetical protein J3R72DRAFT_16403 [Linnemannia gamsii]
MFISSATTSNSIKKEATTFSTVLITRAIRPCLFFLLYSFFHSCSSLLLFLFDCLVIINPSLLHSLSLSLSLSVSLFAIILYSCVCLLLNHSPLSPSLDVSHTGPSTSSSFPPLSNTPGFSFNSFYSP